MKRVLTTVAALGALPVLAFAPAAGAQTYGYDYSYGGGYSPGYGGYGSAQGAVHGSAPHGSAYGQTYGYAQGHGSPRPAPSRQTRYAPPQLPAPYTTYNAYGVNSAHVTGYSHGYGGVGYPYAHVQTHAYGYAHVDRGGRYGYSHGRYDQRRPGYRDRYGYHDDRPPTRWRGGYDYDYGYRYGYDRDCYCQDVYLYDR